MHIYFHENHKGPHHPFSALMTDFITFLWFPLSVIHFWHPLRRIPFHLIPINVFNSDYLIHLHRSLSLSPTGCPFLFTLSP